MLFRRKAGVLVAVLSACAMMQAKADPILITVENMAPNNGTWVTPVWVGFHSGGFDLYNSGLPASAGLVNLAENGDASGLDAAIGLAGGQSYTLGAGPLTPNSGAVTLQVDVDPGNRFLHIGTMVIPSNDAFIGNENPQVVFTAGGDFVGTDLLFTGGDVLDAGSELNNEDPFYMAGPGSANNPGADEGGVVGPHAGYAPAGSGGVLDTDGFGQADFTRYDGNYPVLRVSIQAIPEPATLSMAGMAAIVLLAMRRRRANG